MKFTMTLTPIPAPDTINTLSLVIVGMAVLWPFALGRRNRR